MSNFDEVEAGHRIVLTENWTFRVQFGRVKERMWEALGCNEDPDYRAAYDGLMARGAEMQAILDRGVLVDKPSSTWDGVQWVRSDKTKAPHPNDQKRWNELERAQREVGDAWSESKATLPAGTVIEVVALLRSDPPHDHALKLNIVETSHPGLKFKKNGGTLSNGKRNLIMKQADFADAKFEIRMPERSNGIAP